MYEIISNMLQLIVGAGCAIYSGLLAARHDNQRLFILTCFYFTLALGSLYWAFYLAVNNYSPKIFYVSDLSWIASCLFLVMLCSSVVTPEERRYHTIVEWILMAVLAGLTAYMLLWGDYLATITWHGLLMVSGYLSTRGLLYLRSQKERVPAKEKFYLAILAFVLIEFGLFLSSCFFPTGDLLRPYLWFDQALTASLLFLLTTTKKVADL